MFHGYTEFDRERTLIFVNGENRDSSAEITHKKDICTNRENRGSFEMDVLIDKRIVIMMKKRKLRLFIHSRDSRISRQFWIFLKFPPCFPAFFHLKEELFLQSIFFAKSGVFVVQESSRNQISEMNSIKRYFSTIISKPESKKVFLTQLFPDSDAILHLISL